MKVAVTYENEQIFQHFGHTELFKVYEVKDGAVQSTLLLDTSDREHGTLPGVLKQNGVDALICGGIGPGAKQAVADAGIRLYGGVVGEADKAVDDLLANKLAFNSDIECDHHGGGHGESHGCHGNCSDHSH